MVWLLVGRLGPPRPIPDAVQAHVSGNPIQQARGKRAVEALAIHEHADEDVLAGVERLILGAEQPPTAAKHHRPVPETEGLDVDRFPHAAGVTRSPANVLPADGCDGTAMTAGHQKTRSRPGNDWSRT